MGYRSEVVLVLDIREYKTLLKLFDEKLGKGSKHLLTPEGCDRMTIRDKYIILHYDYIKWYDTYIEVQLLYKLLNREDGSFAIIRIGEDIGDIEYDGDWEILNEVSIYPYQGIDRGEKDIDIDISLKTFDDIRKSTPRYVIQFGKVEVV